jgi:aryl-alcohol dehydrogenase-like predicted oxidoreductase
MEASNTESIIIMRYVAIPGTNLVPSVVCMGGGPLSVENNDQAVNRLLDLFYELGGNIVDSANVYGKWLPSGSNVCDRNIGKWLKSRGLRQKIIVTSKGAHPPLSDMSQSRLSRGDLAADLEESLRALGTDCIDLYYLHRDDPRVPAAEVVDMLNELVSQGKIRYFAASNWTVSRIREAQEYASKSGKQGFCANQIMWSFAVPDKTKITDPTLVVMDATAYAYHSESGLTAIAYESQARGFFQKYTKRDAVQLPAHLEALYANQENIGRCERAVSLARELNLTLSAVALGYLLSQPFPSAAIIGSRTPEQVLDSMAAADIQLSPEQVSWLEG